MITIIASGVVKMSEERLVSLETRVTSLETRVAVAESNIEHINKKLDKIDSNTTWLLRIVVGVIVIAVLGLVVVSSPSIGG